VKVLASSVIRSTHRGDSHGGLYVIDTDLRTYEQVLDWDYPKIRWEGKGGDRGLRGLIFHEGLLYAAGANELFVFNRDFELIDQYTHHLLDGTHELAIHDNKIFNISNCYDAILIFDLKTKQWVSGFQHIKGRHIQWFDPNLHMIQRVDTLHLDTVSVVEYQPGFTWIFYAGSTTEYLYGVTTGRKEMALPLVFKNTHNAQFWKNGIVFNRSLESDTCYQVGEELRQHWPTPRCHTDNFTHVESNDHARAEYTRGMVLGEDSIVIGTSPACVHEFVLGETEPVSSVRLTYDIRNSICGMTRYEW
jgi:hypothetical protein